MTNATDKRQITADFPDFASKDIDFELASTIAINTGNAEIFPQKRYTMTLESDGTDDGAFYLPTPDADNSSAWGWFVELPDGERTYVTLAYGDGSALSLAEMLAAAATSTTASDLTGLYVLKAGDTMSGQLNFSGTDHAGIKLLSLTTAQKTALTGAAGMLLYDSTLGQLFVYDASGWETPLLLSGGTMTGDIDVNGNEVTNMIDRQKIATDSITGATYTLDPQTASLFIIEIQLTTTLTVSTTGAADGDSFVLRLTQDSTGSRTVTWANVNWDGNTPPTLQTAANDYNYFTFIYNGAETIWDGFTGGAFNSLL